MIIKGKNYFKIGLVATVAGILDEKKTEKHHHHRHHHHHHFICPKYNSNNE